MKNNQSSTTQPSLHPKERGLIQHCLKFHDEINEAAIHLAPYKIALYTHELAKKFHAFYESCPILKANENEKQQRVFITMQTKAFLTRCLSILGISAPEKM